MKEYVVIQLKDMCYYDDDFEYDPIIVVKDADFEKKFKRLKKVCGNYESFDEVEEFIADNFETLKYEQRIIQI